MNGVLNLNKEKYISSFGAVAKVRKLANTKKVGHTGTLDPLATGVLPICIGKATKIADYIMEDNKTYKTTLKLGFTSDTYDKEGTIIKTSDILPNSEDVIECINTFIGEIHQIPPMYSAIKVNGKKLYELARQGIEIERKSRLINIYNIEILKIDLPYVEFAVDCSKGTYIRSLCYDIGNKLGCGAIMWELQRTKTGSFSIENSNLLNELDTENIEEHLISIEDALSKFHKFNFDKRYENALLNGVKIRDENLLLNFKENNLYRIYIDNLFIGIGRKNKEYFSIVKLLI
ncbi:MAG: tRNA pseudouridine(55) synthase TruB [Clostridiaceae bacterium]